MSDDAKKTSPVQFFKEVRQEGRKVTWTSRQELVVTTIMVLIMVVIAGLFFLAVDFLISSGIRIIMNLFG